MVKPQYLSILAEGQDEQSSTLSQPSEVATLFALISDLSWNDLVDGLDPLSERIAHTDYFAATMDYMPAYRPYDGGTLRGIAVQHVLKPRLLFPDEPHLLSDSEVTMEYTGQSLASAAGGMSISIGYIGASYAGFGPVGMFGFVLGIGWGLMYAYVTRKAHVPVLGLTVALSVVSGAYPFEMASIKLLGGVLMTFLVIAVLFRLLEQRTADWLGAGETQDAFDEEPEDDAHGVLAGALR